MRRFLFHWYFSSPSGKGLSNCPNRSVLPLSPPSLLMNSLQLLPNTFVRCYWRLRLRCRRTFDECLMIFVAHENDEAVSEHNSIKYKYYAFVRSILCCNKYQQSSKDINLKSSNILALDPSPTSKLRLISNCPKLQHHYQQKFHSNANKRTRDLN